MLHMLEESIYLEPTMEEMELVQAIPGLRFHIGMEDQELSLLMPINIARRSLRLTTIKFYLEMMVEFFSVTITEQI